MNKKLATIEDVDESVDDLARTCAVQFNAIDKQFVSIDKQFAQIHDRFDKQDQKFEGILSRMDTFIVLMRGHEKRLGKIEARLATI